MTAKNTHDRDSASKRLDTIPEFKPETKPETAQAVEKAVETKAPLDEGLSENWVIRTVEDRPHLVTIGQVGWVGPAQIVCVRSRLAELGDLIATMEG